MRRALRWAALAAFAVVLAVMHHSPDVNEALGGTWWWWLTVAAVTAFFMWRDVRSWKKPPENRPSEPRR
jgi:L-asparagine transporter-like permease